MDKENIIRTRKHHQNQKTIQLLPVIMNDINDLNYIVNSMGFIFNTYILNNLANFIVLTGVMLSALTFWKTFGKMKRSEQYKLVHDIQVMYSAAQIHFGKVVHSKLEFPEDKEREIAIHQGAFMEILNVLEWASFLIIRRELNEELIDYFKPLIIQNYNNCKEWYPNLLDDENEYREMKTLYEKWESIKLQCNQ